MTKAETAKNAGKTTAHRTTVTRQRIFVRDLTVTCKLGVTERERAKTQRIRINVELEVEPERPIHDDPAYVVDYRHIVPSIRDIAWNGAPLLLESLADQIAAACLYDTRTKVVRVRIEKLDRYSDTAGIGIEVEHTRDDE
jgi:dihydroneopterin aldolase